MKKAVRNNRSRRGGGNGELAGMPTQINMHPISTRVFRFGLNATQLNVAITRKCLLSLQAIVWHNGLAPSATTFLQAVRLKRVTVWATAPSSGLNSFSVEWLDPHGPSTQKTASCTNMISGKLVCPVPKNSFAGLWSQVTNSSNYNEALFQLSILPNSIVDVEVDVVYSDGLQSSAETIFRNVDPASLDGAGYAALDNATTLGAAGGQQLGPFADYEITYV